MKKRRYIKGLTKRDLAKQAGVPYHLVMKAEKEGLEIKEITEILGQPDKEPFEEFIKRLRTHIKEGSYSFCKLGKSIGAGRDFVNSFVKGRDISPIATSKLLKQLTKQFSIEP